MDSDKEMLRRSQLEAAVRGERYRRFNDTTRADCASMRQRPGFFDISLRRMRLHLSQFQLSSLTPFMRAKKARSRLRLTPTNWQRTFVGKSDLVVKGENDG